MKALLPFLLRTQLLNLISDIPCKHNPKKNRNKDPNLDPTLKFTLVHVQQIFVRVSFSKSVFHLLQHSILTTSSLNPVTLACSPNSYPHPHPLHSLCSLFRWAFSLPHEYMSRPPAYNCRALLPEFFRSPAALSQGVLKLCCMLESLWEL